MRVLVVNAGSSTVKLTMLDHDDSVLGHHVVEVQDGLWKAEALETALRDLPPPDAVGHRVVHGGRDFNEPVVVDGRVRARLDALCDLAPLHQAKSLGGIDVADAVLPDLPSVACFDTAFHAGLPPAASTYPLPAEWRERYGLRRFGFHGLSHAYATRRAGALLAGDPGRLVVCHLGAGASLAAVRNGRSIDTTMGFTPLEGLVMATRSGSVDPGMLLWLHQYAGIPVNDIADALEHRSGLAALAGTADMRTVVTGAEHGEEHSSLALDVYVHRLRAGIAAMTAALGGLDTLVFTGGVGEHAPGVRERAATGLSYLEIGLHRGRNDATEADADITAAGTRVRTLVITAREDLEIARGARRVLGAGC